ncbi:homeobox-leucine zipper protein HAT5-like isoform X2 [Punica granatum]|uniref:Homeobox-leucine zipper protein n=1 Tax=Punica granatum TaxID=22663 RepID=A0A6P8ECL4_PUNGR|nr:homeobox-leucine zipper protein HAT5-like isoform X2 [Punica granatum]
MLPLVRETCSSWGTEILSSEEEDRSWLRMNPQIGGHFSDHRRRCSAMSITMISHQRKSAASPPNRKTELSKMLALPPRQVAIWFQNRRARWKTKQLERNYDHLKSLYSSLLIDYDSVVKDNEKLRSEVTSLNEKLHGMRFRFAGQGPCVAPIDETPLKAEEGLNTGSGRSSVVDEECPWHINSSRLYFLGDGGLMDVVKSEEYDSGVDDQSHFCNMFGELPMGWWAWP